MLFGCPFLLPFSLVSSSCIFSTRIWRRDFSLQYRKSLVPLYEVEDWLEAGGIDPQTWADQHTWEEQRFPSETKATAWDFFWRWKKKQHYTPPASPTFSPTASLDQPLWPGCLAYMPLSDRSQQIDEQIGTAGSCQGSAVKPVGCAQTSELAWVRTCRDPKPASHRGVSALLSGK